MSTPQHTGTAKLATRANPPSISRDGLCSCGDPLIPGLSRNGGRLTALACVTEGRLFPRDPRGVPQGDAHATPSR